MAFPTVATTSSGSQAQIGTNHTLTLPASIAVGDLLIATFWCTTIAANVTTWSGWTILNATATSAAGAYGLAYRIADGNEASFVTVVTGQSRPSGHVIYRINNWHGTTPPEVGTINTQSAAAVATIDPPAVTPSWGAEDTLWIASLGTQAASPHTKPANYTLYDTEVTAGVPNKYCTMVARELNAASEDPGIWTLSTSFRCHAQTIAVRPAAGGGGGSSAKSFGYIIV